MPISNETRMSIDFGWEHTFPSGDTVTYHMKFYHSDQGGILSISNGPYEPIEVPVEMFTEVSEYLIQLGVIKGAPLTRSPVAGKGGLPGLPVIGKKATTVGQAEPVQSLQAPVAKEEKQVPKEEDPLWQERLKAKAEAATKGTKNKFRSNPKPKNEA